MGWGVRGCRRNSWALPGDFFQDRSATTTSLPPAKISGNKGTRRSPNQDCVLRVRQSHCTCSHVYLPGVTAVTALDQLNQLTKQTEAVAASTAQLKAEVQELFGFMKPAMTCPHCGVHAQQTWGQAKAGHPDADGQYPTPGPFGMTFGFCHHCRRYTFWVQNKLVYPATSSAPKPVENMPDDVKADFLEAREVFDKSPRAAGALLRVGFEKLLGHLGATKTNPNDAIGELVKRGLVLEKDQKAMDVVRVLGNQTVHNGFIKLEDQPKTVRVLFDLVNYIVDQMITRPRQVEAMYATLPADKVAGIEKRDGKK